ncbi:hypothetical protein [Butyrivibrio sp. AE2015]|uniref:hypothetical protein n=1 Tax=Butyrivibrio sp. AE2015 TaxID=1280663 RepID=UPI0003B6E6B0|nr:hypothetical protein [Butyrivibrio sp. AE2015]
MEKTILLKLARLDKNIDFFDEHKKIIDEYGFVDFARIGKSYIADEYVCEKTIFLKESKMDRNRIFRVDTGAKIAEGEHYPEYYANLKKQNIQWIRINSIEVLELEEFMNGYSLRNGRPLDGVFKGSVPWVFVREKDA